VIKGSESPDCYPDSARIQMVRWELEVGGRGGVLKRSFYTREVQQDAANSRTSIISDCISVPIVS
jgi:hypothetical protein